MTETVNSRMDLIGQQQMLQQASASRQSNSEGLSDFRDYLTKRDQQRTDSEKYETNPSEKRSQDPVSNDKNMKKTNDKDSSSDGKKTENKAVEDSSGEKTEEPGKVVNSLASMWESAAMLICMMQQSQDNQEKDNDLELLMDILDGQTEKTSGQDSKILKGAQNDQSTTAEKPVTEDFLMMVAATSVEPESKEQDNPAVTEAQGQMAETMSGLVSETVPEKMIQTTGAGVAAPTIQTGQQEEETEEKDKGELISEKALLDSGNHSKKKTEQTDKNQTGNLQEDPTENLQATAMPSRTFRVAAEPKSEITKTLVHVEQPEDLSKQVLEQIMKHATVRDREFEIQLEPLNLGKIAIRVAYEGANTTVSLLCSDSKTMNLLAQNAREMGAIMEANLGSPAEIHVDKQETNYLNQEREDGNQNKGYNQRENRSDREKNQADDSVDFLQRMRLGMIPITETELFG